MQQEVYVDLYFLINVSMNLLCLMITAALLHRRVFRLRAILAAALGALYAVLSLLLGAGGGIAFLGDVALSFLMCAIAFLQKPVSIPRLLQAVAVQLLTSMLLGGIMTALYAWLNRLHLPLDALQGDGLSVWTFALLSAVAGIATVRGGRFFGFSSKTRSVTVRAVLFGKALTLRAMIDTGNLLRDPFSGKSIIVVERDLLLRALPPSLAAALEKEEPELWLKDPAFARRIRLIPTKTATGEAILAALVPERLCISEGKHTHDADYLLAPAPLGKSAAGFDAVLPPT